MPKRILHEAFFKNPADHRYDKVFGVYATKKEARERLDQEIEKTRTDPILSERFIKDGVGFVPHFRTRRVVDYS